jgi:predicted RecA/RadA family phage recombinase
VPEYTLLMPGYQITLTASATITGGQVLVVTGPGTVGPAGLNTASAVGVAGNDAASGQRLTVHCDGFIHETTASGVITAGQDLVSNATGLVSARNSGANRIGIALTSAADGAQVRWVETESGHAVKSTGATAGTPGTFTPAGSYTPYALADLTGVTASPGTLWTTGQRVVLGNGTNAYWNGTTWVAGTAP